MQVLSDVALRDAFIRCYNNEGYKVVIAFARRSDAIKLVEEIVKIHKNTPIHGIERIHTSPVRNSRINLINGSSIELISVLGENRGIKCNEVIYSNDINTENRDAFRRLEQMVVPYFVKKMMMRFERCKMHNGVFQHSDELDEFLGSFYITE